MDRGRVSSTSRTIAGTLYTLSTTYDLMDRPITLTYPGGEVVTTDYDKQVVNRLTTSSGPTTLVSNVTYNHRLEMTGVVLNNGLTQEYAYYPASDNYRLQFSTLKVTATGYANFFKSYQYDDVGNITLWRTSLIGHSDEYQYFSYDSLGRLKTAKAVGGPAQYDHSSASTDYDYDAIGNLVNMAGMPLGYQDSAHKHAATHRNGSQAFTYDNNGNMVTRIEGSTTYTQAFDVENRLKTVNLTGNSAVTNFAYDASGQRLRTEVAPSGSPAANDTRTFTTYPFPGYEVEQTDTWQYLCADKGGTNCSWQWGHTSTVTRKTYFLGGQAVATRVESIPAQGGDGFYYLHSDHLGSSSLLTNSSGVKVTGSETRYYPYGAQRLAPSQTITDRNFTGQRENLEIGMLYYNARFYLPGIGRFASADTITPDPTNPQQFNRYTYVLGNPLRLVDPTGHWSCSGRENCEATVQTWLNLLDEAGELGQSLGDFFRDSNIEVNFLDIEDLVMQTDYLKNQIKVGIQHMEEILANEGGDGWLLLFAQFGHEVEHMQQGYFLGNSVKGEHLAYKTQIELAENLDAAHGTTIAVDMQIGAAGSPHTGIRYLEFLKDWYTYGVNLDPSSYSDMTDFRLHYFSPNGYYKHIPTFPWTGEIMQAVHQANMGYHAK